MEITCFHCHQKAVFAEKLRFRELCPSCGAYLHSCLQCRLYVGGHCTEPQADKVRDPEGQNYCDWFEATTEGGKQAAKTTGKEEAEALWKKLTKGGEGE